MAATQLTLNYDAILSTTLFNYHKTIIDNISTSNFYFYALTKGEGYEGVEDLGDRAAIPLMYALGSADTYSGWDTLPTGPMDGITSVFFEWRQLSIPIAISALEEKKNRGSETRMSNLLKAKTEQATMGIQEIWAKMLLQGLGMIDNTAGNIETAYVSPNNGSFGVDPLFLFVKKDPTTGTVGSINAANETFWRNQQKQSAAASYAAFKKELRNLYNNCKKGPGGPPTVHLTDQLTSEYYEEVLSASHRNPSYQKADIPFDAVGFKGHAMVWDEFMPNVMARTTTQLDTQGTWAMINPKFIKVKYDKHTNFVNGPFEKPVNQDGKVAHILWLGSHLCGNRKKQGVLYNINTTVVA